MRIHRLLALSVGMVVVLVAVSASAQAPTPAAPPQIPYGAPITLDQPKKAVAAAEAEAKKNIHMAQTFYINYYGAIDEPKVKDLMSACTDAIAKGLANKLYILISSSGGSVEAGMALYGFLRGLPVPLVMHNTGSIISTANVVFLAADERYAAPHSMFQLHGITWSFGQGARLTWAQLQETVSRFRSDEERMSAVITSRTRIGRDELTALFRQGETKDLAFAKEKGIIQDIREPKVPAESPFVTLKFQ